nr:MAG TPA: Helix-turn-helix XRE-family like protein [Caudoviricetes sp.]
MCFNQNRGFPVRLKRLRLDKDLRCVDVAQGTGLSHTAILGYEDGSQIPKMDSLIKLADFFNVSIDWLVGRSDLRRLPKNIDLLALENRLLELGALAEQFRIDMLQRDGE